MRAARRYVIGGRVQGVGFRYFTQRVAAREGVTGWIRNLPDGRVEALAEGEEAALARLERALRTGPGGARVETFSVTEEVPRGDHRGFVIAS